MDTPLFYAFLFLHLAFLVVGFGSVLATDFLGIQWMRRKISTPALYQMTGHLQKLVWIGWIGLVASGIGLLVLKGSVDNLTKIKLFFVVLVGVNGIFLHRIRRIFHALGDRHMPMDLKFHVALASLISQVGWWGAIFIGFIHRHIAHNIPWPENPYLYMLYIAGGFATLLILGEIVLAKPQQYRNTL